jgi:hypothetical protein
LLQLTEEKLNLTNDKTEYDSNFEALIERQEATKNLTEKIVKDTEALLVSSTFAAYNPFASTHYLLFNDLSRFQIPEIVLRISYSRRLRRRSHNVYQILNIWDLT